MFKCCIASASKPYRVHPNPNPDRVKIIIMFFCFVSSLKVQRWYKDVLNHHVGERAHWGGDPLEGVLASPSKCLEWVLRWEVSILLCKFPHWREMRGDMIALIVVTLGLKLKSRYKWVTQIWGWGVLGVESRSLVWCRGKIGWETHLNINYLYGGSELWEIL